MTRSRILAAMFTWVLLLAAPAVSIAKTDVQVHAHAHASLKVTGVVRSLDPAKGAVTVVVRRRVGRRHRTHTRVMTFNISHTQISGQGGAVAVGERVTVSFSTSTPGQATSIRVIGAPNGGASGHGAAFAGVISSVDTGNDTLTLIQSTDGSSPNSATVQVSGTTVFAVPGASDGGASGLADLNVGDRAVVFTDDVTAVPVIAIAVLDIGHGTHSPPPPPRPGQPINGMVSATSTSSETLTILAPGGGGQSPGGSGGDGGGVQTVTVDVNGSTRFGGQNSAGAVQSLGDVQVGDLVTVEAAAAVSNGTVTALGVFDHGKPTVSGLSNVIGSVSAVDSNGGTLTLTVSKGPETGQVVTAQVSSHTRLFVSDPTGHETLADVKVGDRIGVGFQGSFSTQLNALVVYDLSNPPSSSH
ncbi:MAG: DUF5666 domain-containing protein [Actinomycetota bacterium]|nr:DUF5666 domain-containing protein [Actinomycetota bacterium]